MMIFVFFGIENIVVVGENAGYQHFLLSPQFLQELSLSGLLNLGLCGKEFGGKNTVQTTDKMKNQETDRCSGCRNITGILLKGCYIQTEKCFYLCNLKVFAERHQIDCDSVYEICL